jgi:hypothetical protein
MRGQRFSLKEKQSIGVIHWKRPQEKRVQDAKDHRIRADGQR